MWEGNVAPRIQPPKKLQKVANQKINNHAKIKQMAIKNKQENRTTASKDGNDRRYSRSAGDGIVRGGILLSCTIRVIPIPICQDLDNYAKAESSYLETRSQ
jgi:hypothetical protein